MDRYLSYTDIAHQPVTSIHLNGTITNTSHEHHSASNPSNDSPGPRTARRLPHLAGSIPFVRDHLVCKGRTIDLDSDSEKRYQGCRKGLVEGSKALQDVGDVGNQAGTASARYITLSRYSQVFEAS
jgi:hypothetical protein